MIETIRVELDRYVEVHHSVAACWVGAIPPHFVGSYCIESMARGSFHPFSGYGPRFEFSPYVIHSLA